MEQLGYIVGAPVRDSILLKYFQTWKFKHPHVNDLIRLAENESGIQLDWYKDFFVNTNKTIDYGIDSLWEANGKTNIRFKNYGTMPLPLDIEFEFKNGNTTWILIANWKDNIADDVYISFETTANTAKFVLGLCPEEAYQAMIENAVANLNNDMFWKKQLQQDLWIHRQIENL
jgi:hypothetical protein